MKDRILLNTLSLASSVCPSVCFVISFVLFAGIESKSLSRTLLISETEAWLVCFIPFQRVRAL